MQVDQNREHIRSNISLAAQVIPEGGECIDVMVKDLSLHGIQVGAQHGLEVGQKCRIHIQFGHLNDELPIVADGIIVRTLDDCFAIQFETVGFESHEELESMILAHSHDQKQCLKEFTKESFFFDPLSAFDFDPTKPR